MTPLLLLSVALGTGAPNCQATLEGTVRDQASGAPLPSVKLSIDGHKTQRTESAADGRFVFTGLCPGPHRLSARRLDHRTKTIHLTLPAPGPVRIRLEAAPIVPIDDVVIAAPRLRAEDTRAVAALQGDALDRVRGQGLAQALSALPGVTRLGTGNTAKPIVRGHVGARVLLAYDGLRHEAQDWGLDHAPEIDAFAADRVEVLKGQASLRYGPDALGGVVLVDPPPLWSKPGGYASAEVLGALNGRRGATALRLDVVPESAPRLRFRIDGNLSRSAALQTPDYPLDNTGLQESNLGAVAAYDAGPRMLKLSFRQNDLKAGVCRCIRAESPDDFEAQLRQANPIGVDSFQSRYAIDRPYQQVRHRMLWLRGHWPLAAGLRLDGTYGFQQNRRREFDTARRAVTAPQHDFRLDTHSLDLRTETDPIPWGTKLKSQVEVGATAEYQQNRYQGRPLIPDYESARGGAFLRPKLLGTRWAVEGGLRYDRVHRTSHLSKNTARRFESIDRDALAACRRRGDGRDCRQVFESIALSAGGRLELGAGWTTQLEVSTTGRIPTADEQFIHGSAPSFPILAIGDPRLGPERSRAIAAELALDRPWLQLTLSGYAQDIDNYIQLAPERDSDGRPAFAETITGVVPRFRYERRPARLIGAEGQIAVPLRPITLRLHGATVRAQARDTGAPLPRMPADQLGAAAEWRTEKLAGLRTPFLRIEATWVRRQTRFDPDADFAPPPPGYGLLGVSAGTHFDAGGTRHRVVLTAENLANARYRDAVSLLRYYADEPGRQVTLRWQGDLSW